MILRDAEEWAGRSVVVLGLAKSGVAVAKLLHRLGAQVVVNDKKPREACPEADELEALGIRVICGHHPDDLLTNGVDVLVKNPGIPYSAAPVRQAQEMGIPVITEVEVSGGLTASRLVGITGSNGKTTTTSLVGQMLSAGGISSRVAGNIGMALSEVVQETRPDEWLVVELSSFQLKGTERFHPKVAALLNVVPAHLDYHGTMEDYIASKQRLFRNQTSEDAAVFNRDNPVCRETAASVKSRVWWFSRRETVPRGAMVEDGWVHLRTDERKIPLLPVKEVALPGAHHLENALAAAVIAHLCGCPADAIANVLRTFRGVEHRLEYVGTVDGVSYYNDSKATNAQAAIRALESFDQPIVWIGGGLDRGVDFHELVPVFAQRVKAVVAYGQSAPILLARAEEAGVPIRLGVKDVAEAVAEASKAAQPGDVVLLSPACASWDMYTSFEERGSIFKQAVHRL